MNPIPVLETLKIKRRRRLRKFRFVVVVLLALFIMLSSYTQTARLMELKNIMDKPKNFDASVLTLGICVVLACIVLVVNAFKLGKESRYEI